MREVMTDKEGGLGAFIKERRSELRLSQAELGKRCGFSQSYIQQLEQGFNYSSGKPMSPTIDALEALSRALQCPLEKLTMIALGKGAEKAAKTDDEFQDFLERVRALGPEGWRDLRDRVEYLEYKRLKDQNQ